MEMMRNGVSPQPTAWDSQSDECDVKDLKKGEFLPQYKALLIRNFTLKMRERRKTITEFFMPVYFMVILIILRLTIPDTTYDAITAPHGQSDLKTSVQFLWDQALHVAPNTTEVESIIQEVKYLAESEGPTLEVYYYNSEKDLIDQFNQNKSSMKYAIVFSDEPLQDMNYTLRLDPLQVYIPPASNRWTSGSECRQTNPNASLNVVCSPTSYYYSSFLAIQLLVDMSIIRLTSGVDVPLPNVTLQHFPRDQYTENGAIALRSIVPLYMVFAWAQFIVYMLMLVVEEKEKKIKESMKMMGLRDSVYWLSWFTIYSAYVLMLAIICIIILPLGQVFQHANIFLLFVLFILYGCSSIVFALMLTPFFNKAKVAGIAGNLIQVMFSLLYYIQVFVGDRINAAVYWAMGLLSPCAFSLAIDRVLVLDIEGTGLNFDNIWEGPGIPFAGSLIMISVDIILYISLAYYLDNVIPSEYGTKRKPWFIFQKSFWFPKNNEFKFHSLTSQDNVGYEDYDEIPESPDLEPVASEFKGKAAVRIRHLKKTFHPNGKDPIHAVDGISLDIYESQITAILGHNGAGKTTLFNILTGMTAPTSGTASIFGLDISDPNDLTTIHRITGICPQHDIIFMTLTPREHLSFFARIRGIPENEVEDEVEKTLKEADLLSKADTKGADLSGGQKRKLSIGIALIGDPRIIFLDEPTAGVDAYSRRHLWTLLRSRKKGKVILLTTHFMDEADILADRKAIVSHGKLRCCGSSLFLKNKFGLGYHLTLVVEENAKPDDVTKVLKKAVTEVQFGRHYGKEMSFILPSESTKEFPDLFSLLDEQIKASNKSNGIEGYGISMTTLEEVFLSLSDEHEGAETKAIDDLGKQMLKEKSPSFSQTQDAASTLSLENNAAVNGHAPKDTSGYTIKSVEVKRDTWRAFKSMMKFRAVGYFREPAAVAFLIVFPIIFATIGILIADMQEFSQPTDAILALNPWTYGNNDALLHNNTDHDLSAVESVFAADNVSVEFFNGTYSEIYDLRPHFSAWMIDEFPDIDMQDIPVEMTLGFNDSFVHSLPILVNLLSNTVLSAIGNSSTIDIYSQMLPQFQGSTEFDPKTFFAPFMLGITFIMVPAGLTMDIVNDREIGARDMMRLNGVGFHMYFSSFFLVMGGMYMISYLALLIIIAAFGLASLMIPPAFAAVAILYLLYMPAALLYSAVFGYIFDKAETARQFYPSISSTLGMLCYNAVAIVDMVVGVKNGVNVATYIHYAVTVLFPHYIPFGLLYYVNKIYLICSIKGDCSSLTASDYMTKEIIIMFIMVLVDIPLYYMLLRLVDSLKLGGSWREALWIKNPPKVRSKQNEESGIDAPTNEDDDVIAERVTVSAALMNGDEVSPAIIYDLGKIYKGAEEKKHPCKPSKVKKNQFVALKSVSLEVKSGQVFGLLGPNGAGKTTSLRIMTAQEKPSKGRVQICGKEIISSLSEVFANLGYCPQHDSLYKNITVAEHIELFSEIRGIKEDQIKPLIATYLKGLEIEEHGNKYSQNCSGGTKRKLSYILSMIGRPKVVLLDEPSTGMDPQSKRFLWDSILASFKGDRSAILTTHSMEEADALCSRIGILVRGGLRCIGAIQHLKNKYGGGYTLEIKLSLQMNSQTENLEVVTVSPNSVRDAAMLSEVNAGNQVRRLVMETFPNAVLDEEFEERLMYKIPQNDITSLSGCFIMLEKAKTDGWLLEYALSQTTLEQVFLQFARQQEEGDPTDDAEVPRKENLVTEL